MEHLHFLILIMPAMTCLNWVIFHSVYANRTDYFRYIFLLFSACFLLLMVDAIFDAPGVSFQTVSWSNLLAQLTAPCIIPLTWLYLEKLQKGPQHHSILYSVWILIPVSLFTGAVMLYSISSPEEIEEILRYTYDNGWDEIASFEGSLAYIYYIWTVIVFRGIVLVEAIMLIVYLTGLFFKEKISLVQLFRFLFKKESISVLHLQVFNVIANLILCPLKLFPLKRFVDSNPGIIIALDLSLVVILALFGMTALLSPRKEITLKEFANCFLYNYGTGNRKEFLRFYTTTLLKQADRETRNAVRNFMDNMDMQETENQLSEEPTISERLFSKAAAGWGQDSLQSEFDRLMTEEQLFLNPKLRLDDIAERLHTNKTYISRMVNQSYNIGFSELINIMRIDYAEQYILNNRTAKQAEIAEACGFISASAFNSVFKKVTGMTPKAWVSRWKSENETM